MADELNQVGVLLREANWERAGRDLIAGRGSAAWIALSRLRLLAPRTTWVLS